MTIIFTHLDADGVCSAALIKMIKKYSNAQVFFTHPAGLGHDIKGVEDDLIICDIALDKRSYNKTYSRLEKISKTYSIHYFDHHSMPGPLPPAVINIHNERVSATEIVYRYFYHELPEYADHIALLGAICDYLDNTPLMQEMLHHYERRSLFLDAGLLAQGLMKSNSGSRYDTLRNVVKRLSKGEFPCDIKFLAEGALKVSRREKEIRKKIITLYKKRENFAYIINPPFGSRSKIAYWILGHSGLYLGLTIRYLKSKPNLVDITIRGRYLVDLKMIIPPIVQKFDGSAGGHTNALGCRLLKDKLDQFLDLLDIKLSNLEIIHPPTIKDLIPLVDNIYEKN